MAKILVFLFSFLVLTNFSIDPDFGWHMAYGETFLKSGHIIRGDPFSWTTPGYIWGNSYFLYQIFIAYIFDKFGYLVLAVLFGLVASLGVLILSFKNLNFFKTILVVLGAVVAGTNLAVRPHTLSFFLFCTLLVFLEKGFFSKPRHIVVWFLFFSVWANVHRAFVVGILVFGTFLVLEFLQKKSRLTKDKLLVGAGCFLAGILGSFLTPYPLNLWKSGVLFDLTTFENLRYIAEWQPAAFSLPASIFLALSGAVFVFIFRKKHKEIGPTYAIVAAILFSIAFVSVTFTFFWAAIFIFIVSRHFDINVRIPGDIWSRVPLAFCTMAVFFALFLNFLANFIESYDFGDRIAKDGYPVRALMYINKKGLAAGLFNNYDWGGFIDWQYPQMKVFIDGRMAGWRKTDGTSILGDYMSVERGSCDAFSRYKIDVALVKKNSKSVCFVDWKVEYEDNIAKVLRRAS